MAEKYEVQAGLSLDIALTAQCLLRCRYCTVAKDPTRELAADQWQRIMGSIAQIREIQSISLEGGEPLLRKDLASILESSLHQASNVKIVTSGALPCRIPASLLLNPRFHFEVSLDGPAPIHDFLRDRSYHQALDFMMDCIRRRIRVRFRTVISRYNLSFYETWVAEMDRRVEGVEGKIGFFFDTLIAPLPLLNVGGFVKRAAMREYPVAGLIPSPFEIGALFGRIKERPLRNLEFIQEEPLRGCQAGKFLSLSFDPTGAYSYCCESPNGSGSILDHSAETCLAYLEKFAHDHPCRACPHFANHICLGCWTGQKCGMVGHWGFAACRDLLSSIDRGTRRLEVERKRFVSEGHRMKI
jgi:hypothetical protein